MSTVIDLSALGTQGFVIQGDMAGDLAGFSVASAGDVNGDGFADVIVGAPSAYVRGQPIGAAYVIFGKAGGFGRIDLSALAAADGFVIQGVSPYDFTGLSVASAGDVNGDGFADMIVAAPYSDYGGASAGDVYVIFGKAGGFGAVQLGPLAPTVGFVIQGDAAYDRAGDSVASAGDVNGDGFADLIVGAPGGDDGGANAGEAYVVFGKAGGFGRIDLTALAPADGFVIQGDAADDAAGFSVSSAGDVNGDGFADLIVGAPFGDDGGANAGEAYVIFGKAGGFGATDLSTLSRADGFVIQGDLATDYAGFSVSSAGDMNGDGFADIIVGAPFGGDSRGNPGEAYVIFGKAGGFGRVDITGLAPADGFVIQGDNSFAADDRAGRSVSAAGDVNGDGFADVIVGAYQNDDGGVDAGAAYVIFGKAGGFGRIDLASLSSADGFIIQGDANLDNAGFSVSAAGDVDGDGFADLIVGARGGDDGGANAGEAYVIFGQAPTTSVVRTGTIADNVIHGGIGDDTLSGLDGNDTLVGGDGDDQVIGGAGGDLLRGEDGDDSLAGGSGDDQLQGGDGDDSLAGSSGNDQLQGGGDADRLDGGSGNDRLDGGVGADILTGGSGNDVYVVDSVGDQVKEQADSGRDVVESAISFSLAGGFVEDLTLTGKGNISATGNDFANVLFGNAGANTLSGGGGADTLVGSKGADTLTGGKGADIFRFNDGHTSASAAKADRITDFAHKDHDVIDLSPIDAIKATPGDDGFTFIGTAAFSGVAGQLRYQVSGADTLVSGDVNGDRAADFTIVLTGNVALVAADFAAGSLQAAGLGGGHPWAQLALGHGALV